MTAQSVNPPILFNQFEYGLKPFWMEVGPQESLSTTTESTNQDGLQNYFSNFNPQMVKSSPSPKKKNKKKASLAVNKISKQNTSSNNKVQGTCKVGKKNSIPVGTPRRSKRLIERSAETRPKSPERRYEPKHREIKPLKSLLKDGNRNNKKERKSLGFYSAESSLVMEENVAEDKDGDEDTDNDNNNKEGDQERIPQKENKGVTWSTHLEW